MLAICRELQHLRRKRSLIFGNGKVSPKCWHSFTRESRAVPLSVGLVACTYNTQTKPVEATVGLPGHAAFDVAAREETAKDKELDAKLTALEEEIKAPTFESRAAVWQRANCQNVILGNLTSRCAITKRGTRTA
jgi:hypothetical protein